MTAASASAPSICPVRVLRQSCVSPVARRGWRIISQMAGAPGARRLHVTVKSIDRSENKTRRGGVGSDQRAMRQKIWVEGDERQRDEAGCGSEHFARGGKNQESEKHRENRYRQAYAIE